MYIMNKNARKAFRPPEASNYTNIRHTLLQQHTKHPTNLHYIRITLQRGCGIEHKNNLVLTILYSFTM